MWSQEQLVEDLREIGLESGDAVIVHASLRAVGPILGGAATLAQAFRETLGPEGTLLVPTFTFDHSDPAGWREPPQSPAELERLRRAAPIFDVHRTPAAVRHVGVFPEIVRQQPDARRSDHPAVSFAAIGIRAEELTRDAPFHYPLGENSPLARLYRLNGRVLLLGVNHTANSAIHLAEVWANAPYIHRSATIKVGPETWRVMRGSPECSGGFSRIEPVLRQARGLRRGYIGNAPSQFMRIQMVVSLAIAMLQGDGASLLCSSPTCPWCAVARKMTADQQPLAVTGRDSEGCRFE
jgi:aminoglycoside 3-N-acetyltransferase